MVCFMHACMKPSPLEFRKNGASHKNGRDSKSWDKFLRSIYITCGIMISLAVNSDCVDVVFSLVQLMKLSFSSPSITVLYAAYELWWNF